MFGTLGDAATSKTPRHQSRLTITLTASCTQSRTNTVVVHAGPLPQIRQQKVPSLKRWAPPRFTCQSSKWLTARSEQARVEHRMTVMETVLDRRIMAVRAAVVRGCGKLGSSRKITVWCSKKTILMSREEQAKSTPADTIWAKSWAISATGKEWAQWHTWRAWSNSSQWQPLSMQAHQHSSSTSAVWSSHLITAAGTVWIMQSSLSDLMKVVRKTVKQSLIPKVTTLLQIVSQPNGGTDALRDADSLQTFTFPTGLSWTHGAITMATRAS